MSYDIKMEAVNTSRIRNSEQKSASSFDKLWLLTWKNFLVQFRHWIRTIIEVVLFGLFICSLYFLKDLPNPATYPPEHIRSLILMFEQIGIMVGILIVLSFMFPTINNVRYITIEKERQLKEAMKIMGLPSWMHWTSWYIRIQIFMIIAIFIILGLLKAFALHADWSVLLVFLFVYSFSVITYCFMLSVFFSKTNIATVVAGICWLVLIVPYTFSLDNETVKVWSCVSSNTAILMGFGLIFKYEVINPGKGIQWKDFWEKPMSTDQLTLGDVTIFILVTSLFYLLVALYFEKVFPGEFGVPEKFYFPLTKTFWCGLSADKSAENDIIISNPNFESDPRHRRAGIKVRNLRKVYGNKKTAVNGLTLNMFDDQITVLLGHNGAGKTTTMSMLTGMFPPTSGTANINGYDIRTNINKARSSLGYCPQHNILFDELTVSEHIEFFGRLKGLKKSEIKDEVNKYVTQLELEPKRNALSQSLSGGMKRKLSIAIALCGNSKVVFCDEPTSGMDPTARRALWDLLQNEKKGRTILLTTHFMDEADVLGDRIAIMAEGELKCYGTPFFLKKSFGSGYRIVCVKNDGCNSSKVTEVLHQFIPEVEVHEDIASELTYILPVEHVNQFQSIFEALEKRQDELKLSSFGVSMTPLEEIFFAVASDSKILDKNDNNGTLNDKNNNNGTSDPESSADTPLLRGFSLHLNQWQAMLKKRFYCWMRSWFMVLLQFFAPVLTVQFIILANRNSIKGLAPVLVIIFTVAVSFVSSFYILFYVRERASKSKLLQFVSGIDIRTYWMSSFFFDFITYLVMVVISSIPFIVYQDELQIDLAPLAVTLIAFGFSMLPMVFLLSFLFSSPSKGLIVMVVISVIINFIFRFIEFVTSAQNTTSKILQWIFLALPQYSLLRCAESLALLAKASASPVQDVYGWENGIGRYLVYLLVSGVVYFALLFMIEFRVFSGAAQSTRGAFEGNLPGDSSSAIDDDVIEEKKKVDAMSSQDLHVNNLVLRKLTKFYGRFLAVNQISVAVKRAECFGLLGVNGAGKTSTFKMLTGDESISGGEAFVQGSSLRSHMSEINKVIGYCPQFDALLDDLTGTETLEIFALLRGVRRSNISAISKHLANELNFQKHVDKKVRELSGGNKRKLSTAIALIGNPVVIYFDEPTTGMDPAAKRNLWNIVSKVRSSGKSIILTSHSMEECEALCTRLAIMVNGEFKCLGSTQHLKSKFSKGFWITLKIMENTEAEINQQSRENDVYAIKNFIGDSFPGSNLNEEYVGLLKYYVPPSDLKWSSVFGIMEEAKQTLPVEDYSIGQTSLEQVFLALTKQQREQVEAKV